MEWLSLLLFISIIAILLLGVPVSLALAGTSLIFSVIGIFLGEFEASFLTGLPRGGPVGAVGGAGAKFPKS